MKKKISLFFIALVCSAQVFSAEKWEQALKGLDYFALNERGKKLHAVRVDPSKLNIDIATPKSGAAFIESISQNGPNALFLMNGGFFTPEKKPLGLVIKDGQTLNLFKKISWWSVFQIKNGKPSIVHSSDFNTTGDISMAVEAGPRLLVSGRIPDQLREGMAQRSAICITKDDRHVIFFATEGWAMTLKELAEKLVAHPFNCKDALNLDGGGSTQFILRAGHIEKTLAGQSTIPYAISVHKK